MPYTADGMPRTLRTRELPAVDDRLVAHESGAEILDGRLLMPPPGADPPHATRHLTLAYLLGAHVASDYIAAVDMLTRTDLKSDFAPDASIYPAAPHPETGGRRLEVLAFEIVSKQQLSVAKTKARKLVARGVERVFAIALKTNRVVEWHARTRNWRAMHLDETIEHACLATPLPIRALLETARADEAVLEALAVRRPELVAAIEARGEAKGEARAEARGERHTIELACELLGIPIDASRRAWLASASLEDLQAVTRSLRTTRRWPTTTR